jgi:tetratricopeptide (TPR) repeat protein
VECQKNHRPKHKKACKKRAAELRHEILFQQPESSHFGDCPICFLPLPLDLSETAITSCCSKTICDGCAFANHLRELKQSLDPTCLFCRQPAKITKEEASLHQKKRAEANDPAALREVGMKTYHEGDYGSAFEYWRKAVELGDINAHYDLAIAYMDGEGLKKDMKKAVYHCEEAAIGGNPVARHNLGCHEENSGRIERAVKHYIIAANLGDDSSLKRLRECYNEGHVQKEDFAAALRAH